MTHLRKVELVGKPQVAHADIAKGDLATGDLAKRDQAGARTSTIDALAAQHNLTLRATAPHAARARALCITRTHMAGIVTMLRYLAANHDHTLSSALLAAGGLTSGGLASGGLASGGLASGGLATGGRLSRTPR